MTNQLATIPVPGTNASLKAVQADGKEWAAARHVCDTLGIDWKNQHRKLESKSWATVVIMTTIAEDGKQRSMSMVDRRTLTMWLATIDTNRVAPEARATLEAFQNEAADALDNYFHEGGAINPRATEEQTKALISKAQLQLQLCQAARGLIQEDHLEAKARIILARGLEEHAELNPNTRPLYVSEYLQARGLPSAAVKSMSPTFGKKVKAEYVSRYGKEPGTYPLSVANGQVRNVAAYTEADRPLMDEVWQDTYKPARETVDA